MSVEIINDPKKLVDYCNGHIQQLERELADAKDFNERRVIRNQLLGFTELLEKALHQQHQQGYDTEDIAKGAPKRKTKGKGRYEADRT
ncbi:MAG TPA: hypothetical protein VJR06_01200 [Nitrososphaerales archaeon]|nr:hypothetical protein [Nitrososphaerales archaeon]